MRHQEHGEKPQLSLDEMKHHLVRLESDLERFRAKGGPMVATLEERLRELRAEISQAEGQVRQARSRPPKAEEDARPAFYARAARYQARKGH